MPSERVIWGPPGTGKTTSGVTLSRSWMGQGVSSGQIAYLAFTKAAAKAAALGIFETEDDTRMAEQFPYFRTLHSLCYMGLRKEKRDLRLINTSDMKQFAHVMSMPGAYSVHDWEDLADVYAGLKDKGRSEWDEALSAYQISRVKAASLGELDAAKVQPNAEGLMMLGLENLRLRIYQSFVEKYERFKLAEGLIDFTDMLEYGVREMKPFEDIRYVILDEAQDLSGIHHVLVDRLLECSREIWWIGDDDQAIFKFSGASAELFLERAKRSQYQIQLRQTHRFGQGIVDFSNQIIKRVDNRHPKEVIGVSGREGKVWISGEFQPVAGDVMILHRHVQGCQAVAQQYVDAGIPFRNERGLDPLGNTKRIRVWQAIQDLSQGKMVTKGYVEDLVHDSMPSTVVGEHGEKVWLVEKGAKTRLEERVTGPVGLRDLIVAKVLTEEGAAAIADKNYRIFKFHENLDYYDRVVKNGYELEYEADAERQIPRVTTIHGSKGRQAERTFVFAEMGNKCWEDWATEHRLAYVASTRTKTDVTVCLESKVGWAKSSYDYPVPEDGTAGHGT